MADLFLFATNDLSEHHNNGAGSRRLQACGGIAPFFFFRKQQAPCHRHKPGSKPYILYIGKIFAGFPALPVCMVQGRDFMARSKTDSYTLEQKLQTSVYDDSELDGRFFTAFLMENRLITHANKQIRKYRQDKCVKQLLAERKALKASLNSTKKKEDIASIKAQLNELNNMLADKRSEYGLSEYAFHTWIAEQQHKYKKRIDSDVAQKLASAVWTAAESVLFGKGKTVHHKKLNDLISLEGKKNTAGIRFRNMRIEWLGLSIGIQVDKNDKYAQEALKHRVKYCRIVRRAVGQRWHYYVQLVLEGRPPKKHVYLEDGRVGLDPGVSCEAAVSEKKCLLTEITPAKDHSNELRRLQRKLDRSLRAMNPGNYKEDGTVKKGRKTWVKSKTYRRDCMRIKSLHRRNAAALKQNEEALANEILCTMGSDIITEKMDYAALQKRAKETKVSEKTGKYKRKKRFGASIGKHAPSRFLSILDRKLGYMGKAVFYVDTWKYKASQYDHSRDRYTKSSIDKRWKNIRGAPVQRDLYSAFLLMNAKDECTIDRERCIKTYRRFHKMHDACIAQMKAEGISKPSVFGF